jgi:virginiamycin A acetyltransferase
VILLKIAPELKYLHDNSEGLKNILNYREGNHISKKARIDDPSRIYNTVIGDYSYVSVNSRISETTIGKFCSIGPNLICGWGIHPLNGITTSPMFYSNINQNGYSYVKEPKIQERKQIRIGHDVFIGMNVTILDGVIIGNGAVIGAGSVVTGNIPNYAIAAGVPAKVIKYRFDEDTICKLIDCSWWDWDEKELYRIEKYFFDVQSFLNEI